MVKKQDWLSCAYDVAQLGKQLRIVVPQPRPAEAAIKFALACDDPRLFLMYWSEGDFNAVRNGWPDAPDEVFIGADPLFKKGE